MAVKYLCPRCKRELSEETDEKLKEEYPFVCKHCEENFYRVEAVVKEV